MWLLLIFLCLLCPQQARCHGSASLFSSISNSDSTPTSRQQRCFVPRRTQQQEDVVARKEEGALPLFSQQDDGHQELMLSPTCDACFSSGTNSTFSTSNLQQEQQQFSASPNAGSSTADSISNTTTIMIAMEQQVALSMNDCCRRREQQGHDDGALQTFSSLPLLSVVSHLLMSLSSSVQVGNDDRTVVQLVLLYQDDDTLCRCCTNDTNRTTTTSTAKYLESTIWESILTSVPCNVQEQLASGTLPLLLSIQSVPSAALAAHRDLHQNAHDEQEYELAKFQALKSIIHDDDSQRRNTNSPNTARRSSLPKVMVLEATNIGGQLLAESLGIATVVLVQDGAPWQQDASAAASLFGNFHFHDKDGWWFAPSLRRAIGNNVARTRWWMQVNRIRQRLGLELMAGTNPLDQYLNRLVAVLLLSADGAIYDGRRLARHVHPLVGPLALLPPCLACHERNNDEASTIILLQTNGRLLSMSSTRSILRGLAMARAEFQRLVDSDLASHCLSSSPSFSTSNGARRQALNAEMCALAKNLAGFQVIWRDASEQIDEDASMMFLPELLPDFVSKDSSSSTSLLELVSTYYTGTVAVISRCDDFDSFSVSALGGPKLLCIPTSNGSKSRFPGKSLSLARGGGGNTAMLESAAIASLLVNMMLTVDSHNGIISQDTQKWPSSIVAHDTGKLSAQIIEAIATAPRNASIQHLRHLVKQRTGRRNFKALRPSMPLFVVVLSAWSVIFVISLLYCLRCINTASPDSGMLSTPAKRMLGSPFFQVASQYLEELDLLWLVVNKVWWTDHDSLHNRIDRFLRRYEQEEGGVATIPNQRSQESTMETLNEHGGRRKRHLRNH